MYPGTAWFTLVKMELEAKIHARAGVGSEPRDIRDLLLAELEAWVIAAGQPQFRAKQLAQWLYGRRVESFDAMANLPFPFRQDLKLYFNLSPVPVAAVKRSVDGTVKLLLRLTDGREIESVIIPTPERTTLCISSQAGCAMKCAFCATARMNLRRNLTATEAFELWKDEFDELYRAGETSGRMMSIGLHPHIIGRAFRIRAIRQFIDYAKRFDGVWWATREEVAACYLTQHTNHIPLQTKPPS